MNDDTTRNGPTRRDTLKYGSAVAAGLGLAGCSDLAGQPGDNGTPTGAGQYTVNMAPMGEVQFDSVPQRWAAYDGGYADMAVALGQADGLTGVGDADRYYRYVYDDLPGVSVDETTLSAHPEVRTREQFYDLESDVHLYDPQMLVNWFDWSESDVAEIRSGVAPFVGNLIFRRSDEWHDYPYYTLYEAFEKVAQVFQQQARYDAFERLHDEFIESIQSRLPPESERPTVFLTYEGTTEPSTFSPYRLDDAGTSKKQWRDLGVSDALAETDVEQLSSSERSELDYENLLEIDPEVILVRGHERKSPTEFRDTVLSYMQDHPVGGELTAVRNERVYRGGYLHQGPIHNLFLTERAAKQLFPEEFGDVTGDAELFDRQRVADIVTGEFDQ
ncbi:ABC transporter substrate-binding protein [Haloarcula laminariae]|uniref:ABC transporter substrate-binding protein n=1 Tax=Haloarcula laminariae TaxID=2961577 RepID=UPI0024057467|nr:ABC transporter substrate-binding protein [Halomicroarcula sp. FL173]